MAAIIDVDGVKQGIADLVAAEVPEHAPEATEDGNELLTSAQGRLQDFSDQLARGEIDRDQLEDDLGQDLLALANMSKLKASGLSAIRLAAFTENVVGLLVRAAVVAALGAI